MQNKISLIFGKKGSGKTTLAKNLAFKNFEKKYLFIWDFLQEYGAFGILIKNPLELISYLLKPSFPIKKFVITEFNENEDFDYLCKVIWNLENVLFIIEEADSVCNPSYISNDFAKLIRYGRHKNIDLIAITRRPYDINRLLTSQADVVYCYKYSEPRDVEYITKYLGCDSESVTALQPFKYYEKTF